MSKCHTAARITWLALATCSGTANAWHSEYSLDVALGYSDNINQSASDPVSQSILIPRLNFDISEDGSSLRAKAVGRLEYRDYLEGAFGNEVRGQLSGIATWIIAPHRLSFDFEDYAAVQPVDILAPNTPNNQQQINVVSLGPTLNFRLFQTLNGQAELRVSNSTASETKQFDSDRALGALRVVREMTPVDTLSANLEVQNVHFTERSGGPDYDRYDAFIRYQSKLSQLDVDLAAGYTRLDFSGAESQSGFLSHAILTWRATPRSTFTVGAIRQFSDAAQDIVVDPAALVAAVQGTGLVVGTTPVSSQVYLEKRLESSYVFHSERFQVRMAPYHKTLDYVIDPTLNQIVNGAVVGFSYRPRPLWTLAFDATEETRDYSFLQRRDEDLRFDLSFTDQLTRHWSVRMDLIRNERNSDAIGQGYRENVVFCTLIYKR